MDQTENQAALDASKESNADDVNISETQTESENAGVKDTALVHSGFGASSAESEAEVPSGDSAAHEETSPPPPPKSTHKADSEDDGDNSEATGDTPTSIWVHLEELRRRLIVVLIAMAITTAIAFTFAEKVLGILAQPIGGIQNLQAIEVTETMGVYMRISLLGGFILAFPILLYELVAFSLPGLKESEKKWVFQMIPFATVLFLMGVAFSYFVMLPAAVPFLTGLLGVRTIPRVSNYIDFVSSLIFWIGIAFEMPIVVYVLVKLKVVSVKTLASQWRIAIVVIAVLSAVITPTVDPVNMALLMLPLILLYVLSLFIGIIAERGNKNEEEEE